MENLVITTKAAAQIAHWIYESENSSTQVKTSHCSNERLVLSKNIFEKESKVFSRTTPYAFEHINDSLQLLLALPRLSQEQQLLSQKPLISSMSQHKT